MNNSILCAIIFALVLSLSECAFVLEDLIASGIVLEYKETSTESNLNDSQKDSIDLGYSLLFSSLHPGMEECPQFDPNEIPRLIGSNDVLPVTPKEFRLSLIRRIINSSSKFSFPATINQMKKFYQSNIPDFTSNLDNWFDTLELFSKNPSKEDLVQFLNYSHSAGHYGHEEIDEDFVTIIEEILNEK